RSSNGRGPGEARDAAWSRRVGARVRWRRSVFLRRRKEWEGESRPPAQARLRGRQRLRDPHRLQEQVVEAALAGGKPLGSSIAWIKRRQIALDTGVPRSEIAQIGVVRRDTR